MSAGEVVFLSDDSENVHRLSTIGRSFIAEAFPRVKNHSPLNVTSSSGGTNFESAPVSSVRLRSASGNQIMWWGGIDEDAPYSGRGFPIYGGEVTDPIPVTNFSSLSVCAAVSGQIIYAIGFLNGADVQLSNNVPENPLNQDLVGPTLVSHSPVSGATDVSRDSNVTALFDEPIGSMSLVSGVFSLSPAVDVTFFVDSENSSQIVLNPVGNLGASATYNVEITTGLTDVAGNPISGTIQWPFTTAVAAPGPDTSGATVTSTTPVSGATNVNIDTDVTIVFSEAMLSGTVTNASNIYLSTTSGAAAPGIAASLTLNAADQKTVTLDPTDSLTEGQKYHINVLTGCQDLAGNPLQGIDRSRHFTTSYNFQEVYNVTGGGTGELYNGSNERIGLLIVGTCDLRNSIPKRIIVRLRKSGSPTGTGFVRIRKGTDDSIAHEFGSIDVSTLTTSYADYTFTDLTNTYTVGTNDKILFEYPDSGSSSNKVEINRTSVGDVYVGADYVSWTESGGYNDDGAKDIAWRIYK